ncbi:extracellular solute-binding protein, family 1 [Candidatus Moduliflexus flocculans]|uniref:Extracellular solute-binding protein, family 1 n=1 Tax=Candidatus Moduliflexus flocculans TaxID=1499966 RepID=A0A0S6VXB1_9BACT|nr:extracellular solute-binding protein, family 1 [Candidatus Moduliflexus flocculans]
MRTRRATFRLKNMAAWLVIMSGVMFTGKLFAAETEQIIFLHYWTGALSGGINDMVSAFSAIHPEYTVRATGFEHESFKISIKVMLAGGNPPDMFSYWAGARVQALVKEGYLDAIDDIWAAEKMDERFPAAIGQACTYNGQKYIIPVTQHYVALFYNTRIFQQLNLTPPATWEEFLAACQKIKAAGITPIALGARDRWPAQFWFDYLLLRTAGPEYRQRLMTHHAAYTDPEVSAAFSLWKDLISQGYLTTNPNMLDWSEAAKQLFHGEAAMTLMGTWIIGLFDGQLGWKQGQDYDFFPFPAVTPEVPGASLGPIDAIAVAKEGKVKAAKTAMVYFSDVEPQQKMSQGSGALSPNMNVPSSFYSDLQQRILDAIRAAPNWAFNYDLATDPDVAELGLNAFAKFLDQPDAIPAILKDVEQQKQKVLPQ